MKKIISLMLTLAILFSVVATPVSAAKNEEFISEVALIYEDSVEEAKAAIAGTEWKLFEQDLNANADYIIDDGVYLIYKTSTNVEDAITDLRVMDMYGGFSASNYEKQLEASRDAYMKTVSYIRIAAAEFAERYNAGDEMAKIAYRQMNYYKDIGETDKRMGDFMLNIPSDEALVTVMMEGNIFVVTNIITLLAIGISGGSKTLAEKISETYAIKDTLTDAKYHYAASALVGEFEEFAARVKRYNALVGEYNLTDENISEEEFQFISEYASVAGMLEQIPYGEETLKDFFLRDGWKIQDLYPIIAAMTEGQLALTDIGVLATVLQYSAPTKSIADLYKLLEATEKEITENGSLKIFDVYMGVDRSIFEGDFAFTTAAERQQALTGMEWNASYYFSEKMDDLIPYTLVKSLMAAGALVATVPLGVAKVTVGIAASAIQTGMSSTAVGQLTSFKIAVFLTSGKGYGTAGASAFFLAAGIGMLVAAAGVIGVSAWYGYYNPDYTAIPNNIVDVRETDLGDKYIMYTAAKVYNDENGRNADFNAYQGKEWNDLYYTKDATAGNCLTPNFVFSDNNSNIARRHQGIAMFGETTAFNLNEHVFSSNAKGAYVTVRYSTTKKAAADVPAVVGSMFSVGAFYAVAALAGAGVGVGGTLLWQKAKKKVED